MSSALHMLHHGGQANFSISWQLCLQVMKIVEEDLSLCHSLAAAMQGHCLELVQYIDTGALVLPAKP